jgi:Skp family chaperone for outer membrane proteins
MKVRQLARRFLGAMLPLIGAAGLLAEETASAVAVGSLSAQLREQASAANDIGWLVASYPSGGAEPVVAFVAPALRRESRYAAMHGEIRLIVASKDDVGKMTRKDVDLIINLDATGNTGLRTVLYAGKSLSKKRPAAGSITVGWVDLSGALADHPLQLEANKLFEKAAASAAQVFVELVEKVQKLNDESNALQAELSRTDLSDAERRGLEKRARDTNAAMEARAGEANTFRKNTTIALRARRDTTRLLLAEEVIESVAKIASKRKVDLVFDTSSVDGDDQPMVIVGVGGHDLNADVLAARRAP